MIVLTADECYKADFLLISSPLDETPLFMDVSPTESDLFSKIKYNDYRTYLCRVSDFAPQNGFIPAHFTPEKKGHPVFWYRRYTDSDLYAIYVLSDFTLSDEEIEANVISCINRLGGKHIGFEKIVKWKYFPHIDTAEMKKGYYTKLEALQGQNRTYYLGELMNFSSVELSAVYSKDLVHRFF